MENGEVTRFVKTWLGVCACASVTMLFAGQLTNIAQVIKHRDARSISVWMMIGGLFASSMWLTYASMILDPYYMTANGLGLLAGIIQGILLFRFGQGQVRTLEEKEAIDVA